MIAHDMILGLAIGAVAGGGIVTMAALPYQKKPLAPCPGEVVSMVIDKDGTILCQYMMAPPIGRTVEKVKQK